MTAAAHSVPPLPGEPGPEVSRLIDFLLAGADGAESPGPYWIAGSVGPRLADGEGRYRLLRPIGRGGWATVYEASDRLLASETSEALVAIKIGRHSRPADADRSLDEARNARRVEHRNVVRVLDCGVADDGRVYTVLELVEGGSTLDERARARRCSHREAAEFISQAARGLEAIHAAGLVHCDIKPANLLVGPDGTVKIADFGASAGQSRKAPLSDASTPDARGTLAFMAPEQFRMERGALTPSSDIFSLGAALFWLLTGEPASGADSLDAIGRLADRDGLDPGNTERRLRAAGIDRRLCAIAARALAPDPRDRYASAGVLAADLAAWLEHRPIEWTRPGPSHRARLFCRRHPLAASALVLAFAGLAAAAVSTARAQHLQTQTAAREAELLAERAARQAEASWRKRSLESLMRLMSGFRAAQERGLASEVLTSLWVLEWAHGPTLLQDPGATAEIWRARIDVLQSVRDRARAAAGPDSIEARLTEPSLALWLLRDGRAAEAAPLLADAIAFWERHSGPDDPWIRELRVLESAAAVLTARQAAQRGQLSEIEQSALAEHERRLGSARDEMRSAGRAGPLAELVAHVLDN